MGRLFNEYVEFFENGSRFRPKVKRSGVADLFNGESLIEYCTSLPAGCGRSWLNNTKAKIESLPPTPINRNVSIMGQDRPQIVTDSIRYDLYNGVEKPSAPNWDYQTKYSRIEEDVTVLQGQSQAWYRQWAPGADKRTNGRQRTIRPKEAGAEKRGINPDDTHWRYSRDSDEFRHGGTFYDNEPVKLPCHRRKGGKPCTGKNSPFREFDVGVHPDWRPGDPRTGHRGGGRLIVNTRTGEMFLTFDHYETFYYLEGRNVFKTRPSYYVNRRTTLPEGIRVMAQ